MSTEEKMTIDERYKYFRMMKRRYERANRQEKGQILDEMQAFTGQHRKGLIRSMNGNPERQPRATQRGSSYGPAVDDALRFIDESLEHIWCARPRSWPYTVNGKLPHPCWSNWARSVGRLSPAAAFAPDYTSSGRSYTTGKPARITASRMSLVPMIPSR